MCVKAWFVETPHLMWKLVIFILISLLEIIKNTMRFSEAVIFIQSCHSKWHNFSQTGDTFVLPAVELKPVSPFNTHALTHSCCIDVQTTEEAEPECSVFTADHSSFDSTCVSVWLYFRRLKTNQTYILEKHKRENPIKCLRCLLSWTMLLLPPILCSD